MPTNISRLRRWFAVGAILVALLVAGTYLYARWRFSLVRLFIPAKINVEVQQTAQGFSISKSEQGRTIFTIRASQAVQYKQGGHAELHDVTIIIFGHDASRFDQISGTQFDYSPNTGIVVSRGEVQIDLQANPRGILHPDQAIPEELKNPVHLVTNGLIFNQKTGDASTTEKIEFKIPQASGSAVGARYTAKDGVLYLVSKIDVTLAGPSPAKLVAAQGWLRNRPRQIDLDHPRLVQEAEQIESEHGTISLRDDSTVEKLVATGGVHMKAQGKSSLDARSDQAELLFTPDHNTLRNAVLSGNVQMDSTGPQSAHAAAGRVLLNFKGRNLLATARAEENVRLIQHQGGAAGAPPQTNAAPAGKKQDLEVTAAAIDFVINQGRSLRTATTSGLAQIALLPVAPDLDSRTVITAGKFDAKFDDLNHLSSVHGAPEAKIVNSGPGQPDRISTSRQLDATFLSAGGIDVIAQEGSVAYVDGQRKAWGDRARYTLADQVLRLSGSTRAEEGGMTTTARRMRIDRVSGDALAEGDVKTTYSDLKPQPNGALLASSSPIHVTSRSMVTHRNPGIATYTGNARLWQDANVVQAPSIEFDRDQRYLVAHGESQQPVSTVLIQAGKEGKPSPVLVTSNYLTYVDEERKAHYEGSVAAKSEDATMTGDKVDIYLQPQSGQKNSASPAAQTSLGGSRLEKIIADGRVILLQPLRRAQGNHLVYTAADDKYVLTGGPPSIFDAEHGKVTGDSLTFYKRDDRVLVEGDNKSPTVTQTRVAR